MLSPFHSQICSARAYDRVHANIFPAITTYNSCERDLAVKIQVSDTNHSSLRVHSNCYSQTFGKIENESESHGVQPD